MSNKAAQAFRICFCFRRIFHLRVAEPPNEIKSLFQQYSVNGTMSIDHLLNFLHDYQGEHDAKQENANEILNSLKHLNIFHRKGLHLEAFFSYLLSDLNTPLSNSHEVHHDMNQPLAHYFLYTGHNSYLTGNQLNSDSSTEAIVRSLEKGVRVIELDLWPSPGHDDVEVRHGGTMTKPVELLDCLLAIRANAFIASEYPLIITFEDHIPPHLQVKVAKMLRQIFGQMLYVSGSESSENFTSPEKLKGKILISTKPPEYVEDDKIHMEKERSNDDFEFTNMHEEDEEKAGYKSLITIHAGKPKGGVESWFVNQSRAKRISLSEQEFEDVAKTHGTHIVRFTQRNLLRIYPKGTRFDSSNYNPMIGWMHGAQMVAFNMQGHGKFLRLMEGMFRANGGCGYLKKPDFLLTENLNGKVFDPREELPIKKTLKVKVFMGDGWHSEFRHTHFDLYSPPDFFVKVGISGVPADCVMKTTKAIEDQWIPIWNEEFQFSMRVPELALMRVEVLEYDTTGKHDFGGETYLPVSELRNGIRAVRLYSRRGKLYKYVRVLMGIDITQQN